MKEITVDVIIPVYRPGERFGELLKRLDAQTQPVPVYHHEYGTGILGPVAF